MPPDRHSAPSRARRAPVLSAGDDPAHATGPIVASSADPARGLRLAVRAADPAQPPGLAQLGDEGWQLTQLTGELSDLAALLAEHTAVYTERPEQIQQTDGTPATENLARACRELVMLRQRLG